MKKKIREWSSTGLHGKCSQILNTYNLLKDTSKRILIIGSGMGNFEQILIEEFQVPVTSITSCDIDPSNFGLDGIVCIQVDANTPLPFEDNLYDIVICLEVIEHLENQWNLVREIKRVKKEDGFALISSPNVESIFNKVYFLFTNKLSYFSQRDFERTGHITPLFSWNFSRMLQKNGMKILHYDSNLFYFWIIPYLFKVKIPFKSILFAQLNIFLIK